MGTRVLKKFKNIRKCTVEDRIGLEHWMNIRTVEVQLGVSELSDRNYYM